jgi:hypothetical protein
LREVGNLRLGAGERTIGAEVLDAEFANLRTHSHREFRLPR